FLLLRKAKSEKAGLIAAFVYCIHPAVIYDSAIWGQVDSIYTLVIVAALLLAYGKQWLFAGAMGALALLTKMQAVGVGPALFLFSLRSLRTFLLMLAGAAVAVLLVCLPFLIGGGWHAALNVYSDSVGKYP